MSTTTDKKKQVPLRISDTLFKELSAWAADDFRSLNGQIEFLLTECVKKRKGSKRLVSSETTTSKEARE
jgi:hypothetical protein